MDEDEMILDETNPKNDNTMFTTGDAKYKQRAG